MIRAAAITLAIGLLVPTKPAAGQVDFSSELDGLHEAVMGLASSTGHFEADLQDVARLHGAVAALRESGDPRRFLCLMDQAALLAAAGDLEGGFHTAALAAAHAEEKRDFFAAGEASVTAAIMARLAGDFAAAETFRGRAEWFATHPTVNPVESAVIATRLYSERWQIASSPPSID